MENKKYPIELEVVTPLSVGAGNDNDWIRGTDFVQKKGKVYVLDFQKMAASGVDINMLSSLFLKSDDEGIANLPGMKLEEVSKYVFDAPCRTRNNIKTFLRTQLFDKPVVAGSSIKGAVRSALFNQLHTSKEDKINDVLGDMKKDTDFMRFIRISDFEMPDTILVNTKIFNLRGFGNNYEGGWKHFATGKDNDSHTTNEYNPFGFNTLYECVAPGRKGIGNISLAQSAFSMMDSKTMDNISHLKQKKEVINSSVNVLFKMINASTKGYLLKEKAFFEKYHAERSDEITDSIQQLIDMIPEDNSYCLIKMSAGVGFHSITGDYQFDNYDDTGFWEDNRNRGKKKYKSRKTAEYQGKLQLMGFVKLRLMSDEEADNSEQKLQAEHKMTLERITAPIKEKEAERARLLEAEQERIKAIEIRKRNQKAFQELMEKAIQAYTDNSWDEAIANAEKAAEIDPDNQAPKELIAKIRQSQQIANFIETEQKANIQKFNQALAEVIKGKISIGALMGTTEKWLKVDGHTFGETEHLALLEEIKRLPGKELKRLKSSRMKIANVIGPEQADKILKAFNL